MANMTFKWNRAAWRALAVSDEIRAAVVEIAEKGLPIAEAMSQDFRVSGDYADSFNVHTDDVVLNTAFGSHPVAAGILENTSGHSLAVEYGNADDSKAHHVLLRTSAALGE